MACGVAAAACASVLQDASSAFWARLRFFALAQQQQLGSGFQDPCRLLALYRTGI